MGEIERLSAVLEAVARFEAEPSGKQPKLRISVLRNYTIEGIVPLLKFYAYRSGLEPEIVLGEYDNVRQEVLDPSSHVYSPPADIVFVSWLLEHLDPNAMRSDWDASIAREAVLATLSDLVERSRALIMVSLLLPPLHHEGSLLSGTRRDHRVNEVRRLNDEIREFAGRHAHQVFVIDSERILQKLGEDRSFDYRFWYMSRAPFKKDFLGTMAIDIVRAGRALKGKAKKCLVLDCDNTLWGGVVGEDGLEGIKLDPFDYPGRCFYEFQTTILNLISQGVIVALCSKNNEEDVLEVIDRHPNFLLRRTQLAGWRVNWSDKASNLAALASELNLGLDSFVFVDDSSIECDLVRRELPEVTVIQAPSSAYELPRLLYRQGLFDTLAVSSEDAARTASYVAERQRTETKRSFASTEEYLASLELRAVIHRAPETELTRVAQLLGKTNQFNLTTRRHSEAQVRDFAASSDAAVFTLTAGDRFGDLGLVAVLIATREGRIGTVDTLLMSCRALGRQLENVFVDHCLSELEEKWELTEWRSVYIPTKKNAQVKGFWDSLGFTPTGALENSVAYAQTVSGRRRHLEHYVRISGE